MSAYSGNDVALGPDLLSGTLATLPVDGMILNQNGHLACVKRIEKALDLLDRASRMESISESDSWLITLPC